MTGDFCDSEAEPAEWYCVRTKPKSEHLAAAQLYSYARLEEVFCPRIRFEKATRRGKVWFVEALFPGYVFARFSLSEHLRHVQATPGVTGVLRFATRYAVIEADCLEELRREFPESGDGVRVVAPALEVGDEVTVTEGVMKGMKSLVSSLLPGKERVKILMEWLGQEREVEVEVRAVHRVGNIREEIQGLGGGES